MDQLIKFGTDGIRGNAKKFPFTQKALIVLGYSIAQWAIKKHGEKTTILIGHDTRESCQRIKQNLESGLLNFKIRILDAQIVTTPTVCKMINLKNRFDIGIIISASHNPYYDNGIKLIDKNDGKLHQTDEKKIEDLFSKNYFNFNNIILENKGSINPWKNVNKEYLNILENQFPKNLLRNKKIVLDCANGAAYQVAPKIFKKLGAEIVTINDTPNGQNINNNCGALHIEHLQKEVLKNNADLGFAFDGDADRVIAVDKNGNKIDGDQIIAILTQHPKAINNKTVVGTIMTNLGLDLYLRGKNIKLIRTPVGDKYVAKELNKQNLFLGGELSGHIIMTDYLNTGDGIFTALRVTETMILKNLKSLKQFTKTPQTLINIPVNQKKNLKQEPYAKIIKNYKQKLKFGRIVVRYSGTENLLRVMSEGNKSKITKNIAIKLAQDLKEALN